MNLPTSRNFGNFLICVLKWWFLNFEGGRKKIGGFFFKEKCVELSVEWIATKTASCEDIEKMQLLELPYSDWVKWIRCSLDTAMQKTTVLRPEFCRINEQLQDKEEQKIYPNWTTQIWRQWDPTIETSDWSG